MSGLLALLDDVVAIAKVAAASLDDVAAQTAKAGAKAAGVVVDDAAVTPRYVTGFAASRELPIVGRIAIGSLKNKLIFLLPAALLLTTFLPQAITPLLMLGGLFLCYEGYEKVHHMIMGHNGSTEAAIAKVAALDSKALEEERVSGAIRTDFILSAEIMAIALAEITAPDLVTKAAVLAAVGFLITAIVYGAVALIVKADDFGVYLARKSNALLQSIGRALVYGMPPFLRLLSFVGMLAMLWVGGGILVHGFAEYGFTQPEHVIHAVAEAIDRAVPAAGAALSWLVSATGAAIIGLIAGAITAVFVTLFINPLFKAREANRS